LKNPSAACDIFQLTPERAAAILALDNNYKRAVHAVRIKNGLSGVRALAGDLAPSSASPPAPAPPPAPASAPAPAFQPGSRAMMLKCQLEQIASRLDEAVATNGLEDY